MKALNIKTNILKVHTFATQSSTTSCVKNHYWKVIIGLLFIACQLGLSNLAMSAPQHSTFSPQSTDQVLTQSVEKKKARALFGDQDISMNTGEVRIIEPHKMTRVAVGDGNLLQAQALETGELLLIGKKTGTTTLQIWHGTNQRSSYRVNIADSENEQDITLRKIVSLKVRIVEFRDSSLKKIGIDWDKSTSGPSFFAAKDFISTPNSYLLNEASGNALSMVGNTGNMPIFLGSSIALNSTINLMQTAGHATTLAEPTLSCLSGESASFLAGGEIPFSVSAPDGETTISFKEYGIKLDVKPKADRHGRISTEIETEVSNVDGTVSVGGAPGFLTRRTQTHMNVMSGQTIIISGLLSKESRESTDYIPGLANLPVIGNLFQSKTMSQDERQLVIFVTPTIIDPRHVTEIATTPIQQTRQQIQHDQEKLNAILNSGLADIHINVKGS